MTTATQNPTYEQIIAEVRAQLGRVNMSKSELGRRAGIAQSTMSRHLHGHTPMEVEELLTISNVLGVPLVDLLRDATRPDGTVPTGDNRHYSGRLRLLPGLPLSPAPSAGIAA